MPARTEGWPEHSHAVDYKKIYKGRVLASISVSDTINVKANTIFCFSFDANQDYKIKITFHG